jgi:hypothetical protein
MEILKYEKFINQLNEGLIMTHGLNYIDSLFRIVLNKIIINYDLVINNTNKTFDLEFQNNLEKIPIILDFINNYGYFPSFIYLELNNGMRNSFKYKDDFFKNFKYSNFRSIKITCEQKFGDTIPINRLYHITPSPNLEKILKKGLAPRSYNKIAYTTSRIYLGYNQEDTEKLAVRLFNLLDIDYKNTSPEYKEFRKKCNTYCLLEINIPSIEEYKKDNKFTKDNDIRDIIRFYNDPNFSEKGCFTYNNIRPEWITYIKDIQF